MDGAVFDVALSSSPGVASCALLREPNANSELVPPGAGPVAVTEMIATLLTKGSSSLLDPADVWRISLSDRDRIVAVLHTACFGDQIESVVSCGTCRLPFELTFSLAEEVLGPFERASPTAILADEFGVYSLPDGRRFRAPNTDDERALLGLSVERGAQELIRRCVLSGDVSSHADDALFAAMEAVAPVLDVHIPVTCPFCQSLERTRFEMVSFFLASLQRERPILLREIHRLASAYHWGLEDIMGLPRSLRQAHVALIEVDRGTLRAVS